jgi:PAS domain S-box-containing protein
MAIAMMQTGMTLVEIDVVIHHQNSDITGSASGSNAEIMKLRRELTLLKQEKADLEILLETTTEHSDSVENQLHEQALEALRQREEWFRTIAEATPVPVLISRISDGEILYANSAAHLTFARSDVALAGQCISELYCDANERDTLVNLVLQTGYVQNYELQAKRNDGTPLWIAASLRKLMFDDEPTILSALCDITARKLQEDALRRQIQELRIEIDHNKLAHQVAEIIETDYFQELQAEIERLRYSDPLD